MEEKMEKLHIKDEQDEDFNMSNTSLNALDVSQTENTNNIERKIVGDILQKLDIKIKDVCNDLNLLKYIHQFPFNDVESFKDFDKSLLNEDEKLNLAQYMSWIGGEAKIYDLIDRTMRQIITDEFAPHFSFKGKGKYKFEDYNIIKALQDASRLLGRTDCTDEVLKEAMKKWLERAIARNKYKNK